jgi:DNA-binding HxlR family transcriptional regulator
MQMIRDRLQELEDQELAEQQRLEEEQKKQEVSSLSLGQEHMALSSSTMNNHMMNMNDFLADPPVQNQPDPMQIEPANGLHPTSP